MRARAGYEERGRIESAFAISYDYVHFGLNQWNGVALISRVGLEDVATSYADDQPHFGALRLPTRRALASKRTGGLAWADSRPRARIVDLYQ